MTVLRLQTHQGATTRASVSCLQSFDPAFDELIGDNQTVYKVGPTRDVIWAAESPAYLSGAHIAWPLNVSVCPAITEQG